MPVIIVVDLLPFPDMKPNVFSKLLIPFKTPLASERSKSKSNPKRGRILLSSSIVLRHALAHEIEEGELAGRDTMLVNVSASQEATKYGTKIVVGYLNEC